MATTSKKPSGGGAPDAARVVEGEVVEEHSGAGTASIALVDSASLEALNRSEIDQQIATAKRYPRSITEFQRVARELACIDQQTAGTMGYAVPRDGKSIKGPSVRLAEIVAYAWGNLRVGSRVVEVGKRSLTAQGYGIDLERNYAAQTSVQRGIVKSSGARFGDAMIQTTAQAACAIAYRETVFKLVPKAYVNLIYKQAMEAFIGKGQTTEQQRAAAFAEYSKIGFKKEDVCRLVRAKGPADIGFDELIELRGFLTALSDGDLSVEELRALARPQAAVVEGASLESIVSGKASGADDAKKGEQPKAGAEPEPEPTSPAEEPGAEEAAALFED